MLHSKPWNPLQRRLIEYLHAERLSLAAFARLAEVPDVQLRRWFRQQNYSIPQRTVRRLAEQLGISFDLARAEAGPAVHSDDRLNQERSKRAAERFRTLTREQRQDFARQGAKGRRGHKDSAEAGANRRKGILRSTKARVVASLNGYLLRHSQATPEDLRQWVIRVRRRHGLTSAFVAGTVRPHLKKRGLHLKEGRPPLSTELAEQRQRIIEERMAGWPRDRNGDPADGFWDAVLSRVKELEGDTAPTNRDSLRNWFRSHRQSA